MHDNFVLEKSTPQSVPEHKVFNKQADTEIWISYKHN